MNSQATDTKYMRRCIELARNGIGYVAPNPMVGSVIVHNDSIIGEGYHHQYGGAHGEVHAIQSVKYPYLLSQSTLYVNLEPCSHHGKTPPCSDLIIYQKIPRVVIANADPYPEVSGKGIKKMKDNGIEVLTGVMEEEAYELNRRFFTFHQYQRPYIILKWAQSGDGYIDKIRPADSPIQPNWITNKTGRIWVHKWRSRESAIMVGRKTAEKDNPRLNTREWPGGSPLRIVMDTRLSLPSSLHLFDQSIPTLIYNKHKNHKENQLEWIQIPDHKTSLNYVMSDLYKRKILSLIVEGGSQLINDFIKHNLWDEARVFAGETFFHDGIRAPVLPVAPSKKEHVGNARLLYFRNTIK